MVWDWHSYCIHVCAFPYRRSGNWYSWIAWLSLPLLTDYKQRYWFSIIQGAIAPGTGMLNGTCAFGCTCPSTLLICLSVHECRLSCLLPCLWIHKRCLSAGGRIEGDVRINGHPKEQDSFARVSGYVEQFDTHSAAATVHEALMFSGILRNEKEIDHDTTEAFVEQVCHQPSFSFSVLVYNLDLPSSLPTSLPPSLLPSFLPSFLPSSLPPFFVLRLPSCLPSFLCLPACQPPSLPTFLFLPWSACLPALLSSLPSFLPSLIAVLGHTTRTSNIECILLCKPDLACSMLSVGL